MYTTQIRPVTDLRNKYAEVENDLENGPVIQSAICWTIKTGTGKSLGNLGTILCNAFGPPVEQAITTMQSEPATGSLFVFFIMKSLSSIPIIPNTILLMSA